MIDFETAMAKGYKLEELKIPFSSLCRRRCSSSQYVEGASNPESWDSRARKYVADQVGMTEGEINQVINGDHEPTMALLNYFDWTYELSSEIETVVVKVKRYKPRAPFAY